MRAWRTQCFHVVYRRVFLKTTFFINFRSTSFHEFSKPIARGIQVFVSNIPNNRGHCDIALRWVNYIFSFFGNNHFVVYRPLWRASAADALRSAVPRRRRTPDSYEFSKEINFFNKRRFTPFLQGTPSCPHGSFPNCGLLIFLTLLWGRQIQACPIQF